MRSDHQRPGMKVPTVSVDRQASRHRVDGPAIGGRSTVVDTSVAIADQRNGVGGVRCTGDGLGDDKERPQKVFVCNCFGLKEWKEALAASVIG